MSYSVVGSAVYIAHNMKQKPCAYGTLLGEGSKSSCGQPPTAPAVKFIKCKDHSNIETWINPDTIRWIEKRNNGQYHVCTSNNGCFPWQTYQVIDEDDINIMIGN